jgi:hypothetical protein
VSGDGTGTGVEVSTSNSSTFVVDADNNTGTYSWGVSYVDDVFNSPTDSCSEVSTLSITN